MKFNGIRYAFSCNHTVRTVELRKDSTDGAVLYSFSNATRTQISLLHSIRLSLRLSSTPLLIGARKARCGNAKGRPG
ncbi:MAG: hypothetical protein KGK16_05925 [Bradyrhizobium sp.]|nr:hypothetical protein [Bradyrhizobium sp.]